MKKITIEVIPHDDQRYKTAGDWQINNDELLISVSDSGNNDYNMLVAVHELVEVLTAVKDGITQKSIDDFDIKYENDRTRGKYTLDQEPGDDPDNPAYKHHQFATTIERMLSHMLNINWAEYESVLSILHNSYKSKSNE